MSVEKPPPPRPLKPELVKDELGTLQAVSTLAALAIVIALALAVSCCDSEPVSQDEPAVMFEHFEALENCIGAGLHQCADKFQRQACEALVVGWCESLCEEPESEQCRRWRS